MDDLVEDVVMALDNGNHLENTFIIFSSDNGFHLGNYMINFCFKCAGKISVYLLDGMYLRS